MENWKVVPDFPEYEVSDYGRIKSLKKIPPIILKPGPHTAGYLVVALHRNKQVMKTVHRLVFESFYGPIPKGLEINHKNGNKKDNRLDNLELMTRSQNILHSVRILKNSHGNKTCGEKHHEAKLTGKQVLEIRDLARTQGMGSIAKLFGCSRGAIAHIVRRRSWKHI